jgi:hypothetical protein
MAKNIKPASAYAPPHTMAGKKVTTEGVIKEIYEGKDPNSLPANKISVRTAGTYRVSAGDPAADNIKRDGIETRGNGAATKGRIARGPMA